MKARANMQGTRDSEVWATILYLDPDLDRKAGYCQQVDQETARWAVPLVLFVGVVGMCAALVVYFW